MKDVPLVAQALLESGEYLPLEKLCLTAERLGVSAGFLIEGSGSIDPVLKELGDPALVGTLAELSAAAPKLERLAEKASQRLEPLEGV